MEGNVCPVCRQRVDVNVVPRRDAEALARAVSAALTHGEEGLLADALRAYLAVYPWSDL